MPGSTNRRRTGFIRKCQSGRRMVFQNERLGDCMKGDEQFPQFNYYSSRYNSRQQNHHHCDNNNEFTPFVFTKNSRKQQPTTNNLLYTNTMHGHKSSNGGYYFHQLNNNYDKELRVNYSPINQFLRYNQAKPVGRLVTNGKAGYVMKNAVNNNKNNNSNRYVNGNQPQQHVPLQRVKSANYIHPFQISVSQSQTSFLQQHQRRKCQQSKQQQQQQQGQQRQNTISMKSNRLQLNSSKNHRVIEINKIENKSSSSLSSNDDSSSLSSIEGDYRYGYHRQCNKYQKHQFALLNDVKQNIPKDQNKQCVLNVHNYNIPSKSPPINKEITIIQHKVTPQQIVKQIQNRTQTLIHQQQIEQYQKQGIYLSKGGLSFQIDIKQFVFDNDVSNSKEYQSNQNQNSSKKVTKNNTLISARSKNNNIQQKKYKKDINSKQELKRRRQLAKCYDQCARQKVFRSQ